MKTLLLDVEPWDLSIDALGNIAIADEPYSIAQDVASAVRLFRGELWYDTTQGVPYFGQMLGTLPPPGFMAAKFIASAETVPEVVSVSVSLNPLDQRRVVSVPTGTLTITDSRGRKARLVARPGTLDFWYVQAVGPEMPN